jgi:hypothetical protein
MLLLTAVDGAAEPRPQLDLDGAWSFRMDAENQGEAESWFQPQAVFEDSVIVPGAWDAQGKGGETDKLHHQFLGKAWYKRQVEAPAAWAGRRIFLCFTGIHRYATVWVNGTRLGDHIGYLSPFEFDVTGQVQSSATLEITVCVDSEQRWEIDALIGAMDMIDYMDTYWGGIYGHVRLEARSAAFLSDLFVAPKAAPPGCEVHATVNGVPPAGSELRLEIVGADGVAAAESRSSVPADPAVRLHLDVPQAALWTPDTPVLYTARLSLLHAGQAIDAVETRFGFREIALDGPAILLNGRRIFLCGYGDDSIFPETMAPPTDKNFYLKRLQEARACGFNYVRHHSTMLPPEYFEACDEAGMFVSAEFPVAYPQFYARAKGEALDLYRSEWTAAVRKLRNHPSIFNWCMGNEVSNGMAIAPDLYRIAKELDPTRPVADTDGIPVEGYAQGTKDRDTLDMYFIQFDVFNTPLENAQFYDCPAPRKPVISHENGNYVTFPRLDQIDLFQHNIKPFWMVEARDKVEKMGLLAETERWAENTGRLYTLLHKIDKEALRKSPNISGYHWWLFQDYWTTSNGLVDTYFRPKPGIDRDAIRQFNGPVVLLQDGIDLLYRGGSTLSAALLVSNFGPGDLTAPAVTYTVRMGDQVLATQEQAVDAVSQGSLAELLRFEVSLPDVAQPMKLTIDAQLRAGETAVSNEWSTWIYPAKVPAPPSGIPVFSSADLHPWLEPMGAKPLPSDDALPAQAVYFSSHLTPQILDAISSGASAILFKPVGFVLAGRTRFKTAWWKGGGEDNNAGTVVYDHPVTSGMAPEGWCDTSWYELLEGADGYLIDELPAPPEVLIRGVEVASVCRNKALLFQAGVGKGSIIICGLNLDAKRPDGAAHPAAEWLTSRLIEHAATLPKPEAILPEAFVRERLAAMPQMNAPHLQGFARLVRNDGEEGSWFTYRHDRAAAIICRQTDKGHLVEWLTTPAPDPISGESVTFVFAGGLGWISQPASGGFVFMVEGKDVLGFDVCKGPGTWRNEKSGVALCLLPRRNDAEDQAGLFYVQVPAKMLEPGKPCRLGVRSEATGSSRWFALHPYTDVVK